MYNIDDISYSLGIYRQYKNITCASQYPYSSITKKQLNFFAKKDIRFIQRYKSSILENLADFRVIQKDL